MVDFWGLLSAFWEISTNLDTATVIWGGGATNLSKSIFCTLLSGYFSLEIDFP